MPDPRHLLGRRAEAAAASWLASCGWTILARRWRSAAAELDLVARDTDGRLVVVEVKCRSSPRTGEAAEAVDPRRLARLRRGLAVYAARPGAVRHDPRIDLVTVTLLDDGRWRIARYEGIDAW